MSSGQTKISIVVRTYGPESVNAILRIIENQKRGNFELQEVILVNGKDNSELVDVDSNSVSLIKKNIAETDFTYGRSLNLGISSAMGDLVVLLSGHSIPANDEWLCQMIEPFTKDSRIVGIVGSQRAYNYSCIVERAYRYLWYGNRYLPVLLYVFNASNACIKKGYWKERYFDECVSSCEDRLWAWSAKRDGYLCRYNEKAIVWHSHKGSNYKTAGDLMRLLYGAVVAYLRYRKEGLNG